MQVSVAKTASAKCLHLKGIFQGLHMQTTRSCQERTVMLLVGPNQFFFPMTASCRIAS